MSLQHSTDAVAAPEDAPETDPQGPPGPSDAQSRDRLSWLLPLAFVVVTAAWILGIAVGVFWLLTAVF